MSDSFTPVLLDYLSTVRASLRHKLEGLSEYDARRPVTPTGTNVLGVIKHVASVEIGYLTECFGRECPVDLSYMGDPTRRNDDFWVPANESRADVLELLDLAELSCTNIVKELPLDAPGHVPWWGARADVTLHQILVHLLAELNRHAGQVDVVREMIDGHVGRRPDDPNLPADGWSWDAYRARVQASADAFREK